MIQTGKINIWIAPHAEGKTYKSVQYCIEQQQQHTIKFIFATCFKFQIVSMMRYIRSLFSAVDCLTITDAIPVLSGAIDTYNANIIFDDVDKNIFKLIALNNVLEKYRFNTVIITVNPHTFKESDLKKCIDKMISRCGEDAVNIIDKIYKP